MQAKTILLFAVDFIPVETVAYRTMRSDYPDEWIESLKQIDQLDFAMLVPGHGQIGKKEHVRLFRGGVSRRVEGRSARTNQERRQS